MKLREDKKTGKKNKENAEQERRRKRGKRKLNANKERAEICKKEAKERKVIKKESIFLSISKHDEEFYTKYFESRFYKNSNT